ncbi:superoxide dismutase, Cu-Zn family [Kushneria avicenniae]|uniref:Superoxide dismutase [Cu-Zn] n=1 Tax=Kushneria avicenniae TaxID=402385 RepID=A0A1I1MH71_9GAMM|nr:superoxide dismutase family protein [Kushneria avicenniae]SFC84831.1 superoxide dismutase, Cu-Zn family [Kushneria avicenniae]
MKRLFLASALLALTPLAMADTTVELHKATQDGVGDSVGTVTFKDTDYGLLATPDISGLPGFGMHGFHLHTNPSCDPATSDGEVTPAGAAGGHFDPEGTGTHAGPYMEDSHLGDMPLLVANDDGQISTPVLAPRLKESDLAGHAVILHEGGDTYSEPPHLGGGGGRWACGVIKDNS